MVGKNLQRFIHICDLVKVAVHSAKAVPLRHDRTLLLPKPVQHPLSASDFWILIHKVEGCDRVRDQRGAQCACSLHFVALDPFWKHFFAAGNSEQTSNPQRGPRKFPSQSRSLSRLPPSAINVSTR